MTDYPVRGSTPWDLTLKAYLDDEVVTPDRVAATLTEDPVASLLDAIFLSRAAQQNPKTGHGLLAYAENATGQATTISTAAVAAGFCEIDIEETSEEALIYWECRLGIVTAPGATYGGSLDGIVWQVTMSGSTVVVTEIDRCPLDVAAGRPIKLGFGKASGRFRIGPSNVTRRYALGAGLVKDNVAGTLVGQLRNQAVEKSAIWAVAP